VPDPNQLRLQSALAAAHVLEREPGGGGVARVFLGVVERLTASDGGRSR
jgi:hypothetical protein